MFLRLKMTQYSQNFNHKEPNGQFWKSKFGVKRFKWNHFFVMANLSSFEKLLWCCHFTHVEAHFPTCFFHFPSMQIPSLTFTVWHHFKVLCRQVSFKTTPSSILLYDMCPNLIFRSLFDAPSPEFLMSIIFFLHFFSLFPSSSSERIILTILCRRPISWQSSLHSYLDTLFPLFLWHSIDTFNHYLLR